MEKGSGLCDCGLNPICI